MSINNVSNVSDALKYVSGMEVSTKERSIVSDAKDSIFNPITLVFGGLEVNSSLKNNLDAKNIKDVFEKVKNVGTVEMGEKVGTSLRSTNIGEQFSTTVENIIKKADDKAAEKVAKQAAKEGAEAASKGFFGTIKSGLSKVGSAISGVVSKIPGASKLKEGLTWLSNTKVGKLAKGTGAVGMMAIEGVLGLVTEVIPAFAQGGFDSGMKQIGKTGLKTVATGAGWVGGTTAATALGAAIGSVFPGVGTVIGGAIGTFIGGMLGSTVASGIADKIVGKSEVEILQDEQFEEAASQVAQDNSAMNELNQLVAAQVQAEIMNGTADEDTEKMAELINTGALATSTISPYTTSVNTTQAAATSETNNIQTNQNTVNTSAQNANYWTEMANKAANGDTSIYNISDEKLESVFSKPNTSSTATNTTAEEEANEGVNYFAVG